ncbi:MAG: ABC transporter ATP-binding protein [Bryobacteraceae bacterium]
MVLVQNVSKLYRLYRHPSDRLRQLLPFARRSLAAEFWALRNVSFSVEAGEVLGVIGPNGSGKSTLLQVVSGILQPTSGRVLTRGRIAALLELGAGFNPEFTGRENVFMNGEILGMSRAEVERIFPKIEEFAEIGAFIDRPVKEYSSGMYIRLAFSTAIHVDPEILIVDEALAVGDAIFANRCIQKFEELKERHVTVLFVSHDLGLVKRLSDRAILMLKGEIAAAGSPKDVVNRYVGHVLERQQERDLLTGAEPGEGALRSSFRHGDGASRVIGVELLNSDGDTCETVRTGERITVRIQARFHRSVSNPVIGVLIRNRLGIDVYGTNSRVEQIDIGEVAAGEIIETDFVFNCVLTRQEYTLTVATQYPDGSSQDWVDDAIAFTVADAKDVAGLANLGAAIHWRRRSPDQENGHP